MPPQPVDTDVAIIGAGTTALLLAQGLRAAGIPTRIFERHPRSHTSREWSMSLHWGGEFLSTVLPPHLRDRLHEIDVDPGHGFEGEGGFVQCDGLTGEVLLDMQGTMPRRVSRRRVRGLLGEGLGVEYDKTLTSFVLNDPDSATPTITSTFSDGSTCTSRLLVGADGSRSAVRSLLLRSQDLATPTPTPYTILNFPCTYPGPIASQLRAIHPVFKVAYHPKLNCMYMLSVLDTEPGEGKGEGEVTFQNLLSWKGAPSAEDVRAEPGLALKRLRELGARFAKPWCTAAANVPDGTPLFADQGAQWDPRPHFTSSISEQEPGKLQTTWNGHAYGSLVTLAGDAAHAMLPHRGQGLNHALEDAAKLVAAITRSVRDGEVEVQQAMAEYEVEMVARGGGEVEVTGKAAKAGHDFDLLMESPAFKYGAHKVR